MDNLMGYLFDLLKRECFFDKINIIIISDHGMANLNDDFKIYIEDLIDTNLIDMNKTVLGVVSLIYPKKNEEVTKLIIILF